MNKVHMKVEFDKLKEEYKDVHELIDQGDSIVIRFDDGKVEACVGEDGTLNFQIQDDDNEGIWRSLEFAKAFPIFNNGLVLDEGFLVFDRPIGDFKLIREILDFLSEQSGE